MNKKIAKALKLITVFILILSLTMSMTGCGALQQDMQSTDTTTTPASIEESDKWGDGNSDTGYYNGERYEEVPTINHRTEAEIEATGLTAQDVLNAYDKMVTDALKADLASPFYSFLPDDVRKDVVGKFVSITPRVYEDPDMNIIEAPFYVFDTDYLPEVYYPPLPVTPAYPVSLNIEMYVDGVICETRLFVGVQKTQFEQAMSVFGQKPYIFDYETFKETEKTFKIYEYYEINKYNPLAKYIEEEVYEPITISIETILNATPEQLQVLYNLISSIYSINFA